MTNFLGTTVGDIIVAAFTIPIISMFVWGVKKLVNNWIDQQNKLTTAFVDHTTKQTIMLEAATRSLEVLNDTVLDQQKKQTDAVLKPLEALADSVRTHATEAHQYYMQNATILSSICDELQERPCLVEVDNASEVTKLKTVTRLQKGHVVA